MSPIDTVRAVYGAFARHDLEGVLTRLDPDITWTTPATLPWSRGTYRGPDEVAEYLDAFLAALDEPAIVPEEFLDAGQHVVVQGREEARVASTGRSFRAPFTHTWNVRGGRVTGMRGVVDTAAIVACFAPDGDG